MKSRTAPGAKVFNKDKERLPGYVEGITVKLL